MTNHLAYGRMWASEAVLPAGDALVVEVLETSADSAKAKAAALAAKAATSPIALVVGLNTKAADGAVGPLNDHTRREQATAKLATLSDAAEDVAAEIERRGLGGGVIPMVWRATNDAGGGYVFPFWEARALLTTHDGAGTLRGGLENPLYRSIDADVTDDPLLHGGLTPAQVHRAMNKGYVLISGGYNWSRNDVARAAAAAGIDTRSAPKVAMLERAIEILNRHEHRVRKELLALGGAKSVYWPEPNTYMTASVRLDGARALEAQARERGVGVSQQNEGIAYATTAHVKHDKATYEPGIATVKPLKTYFSGFLTYFSDAYEAGVFRLGDITDQVLAVRQTHLNVENVEKVLSKQGSTLSLADYGPVVERCLNACVAALAGNLRT